MDVRLTTEPVSSATVAALVESLGLRLVLELPWTDGIRQLGWVEGERRVDLALDAGSGAALLVIDDDTGTLSERLAEALPCEGVEEALARADAAETSRERVRGVVRLSTLLLANSVDSEPILDAIGRRLHDDEPLVRWAAARVLRYRSDRHTERLLAEAAAEHEDLAPVHEQVLEACTLAEDGTLYDGPTDSWWELLRRAREGVAEGKWPRVVKAMDALLESSATHEEGLMLRALAYEHAGEPLLALALACASEAEVGLRLGVLETGDDDDDETSDRDDEERVELEALRDQVTEHRERIEAIVEGLPKPGKGDGRETVADALVQWLDRWDYHTSARAAAARAVLGHLPSIEGLLALEAGSEADSDGRDIDLLRRAVDLVPDAPECRLALAQALGAEAEGVEQVYADTLAALEIPIEERSPLAQTIAATRESSTRASRDRVVDRLTRRAYDAERWDEAIRWADELVQLDPESGYGWQVRANARIFGGRLEDAAEAFAETLVALDQIFDGDGLTLGDDPRPLMRFNWSATLAKLGQRDEALEQLRHAVRGDAKWGQDARTDDFFETLWEDATFLAVAAGEPSALILDEEREPGFLEALVRRCIGLSHMDREDEAIEQCERAIELGEALRRPDQVAKAHSVLARTQALAGSYEEAIASSELAMDRLDQVPPEGRAELVHTHGLVLHQADRLDEAEVAYRRALALRAEVDGDDHPVLAKGYGDLARLASSRGDDPAEVDGLVVKGLELLDAWLSRSDVERDDTWLEAEMDACILQVNRGHTLIMGDDVDGAIAALEGAALRIEQAIGHGTALSPTFLDNATGLARTLEERATTAALRQRAQGTRLRLETAQLDGPPEEIAERLFWRRLRSLARRMHAHGVDDAAFADALSRGLRGELSAAELSAIPELAGFQAEISTRIERYPTLITMIALSLGTVESGGSSVDEALENLEELCVGSLYTEGGPLA